MVSMKRRAFLQSSFFASGALLFSHRSLAQSVQGSSLATSSVGLAIHAATPIGHAIETNFTGLSYEQSQLANPDFFSLKNPQLIGFFRRLGSQGVLRIGGNTSEYCFWNRNATPNAAADHLDAGPDKSDHKIKHRTITPEAIDHLSDFLQATGWSLIYGLNLGYGKPENAADEAAYVMEKVGPDRLLAFQIGNEVDLFSHNGIRSSDYNFNEYAAEWHKFYKAVRRRVPNAPFAGPDTAYNINWVKSFAQRFRHDVIFTSSHYYAEGPPTNPAMTIERLLGPNHELMLESAAIGEIKAQTGLPFRLTECNSCYDGGKWGVSDTFASALWAADLMFEQAAAGAIGINFHGGGYGAYTPIAGSPEAGYVARPEYYGMLLFAAAGPGQLVQTTLSGADSMPLLSTYALRGADGRMRIVLINKEIHQDANLTLSGVASASGKVLRLEAPHVGDTTDITFGGAPVGEKGEWSPLRQEHLEAANGQFQLHLPKASAVLIEFA